LWQATNREARDFRVETIGTAFRATELEPQADGSFVAPVQEPEQGWTAAFVELSYDMGGLFPFKVSTEVRVLPDVRPFEGIDLATTPYERDVRTKAE
jgi:PhoPQ-activated pathogenicity-related protein